MFVYSKSSWILDYLLIEKLYYLAKPMYLRILAPELKTRDAKAKVRSQESGDQR